MSRHSLILLLSLFLCGTAAAYDAVSNANGKASLTLGLVDGDFSANFAGSYSMPVGDRFGAQFDGLYGQLDNHSVFGTGGHFFWRNPKYALFGLTSSYLLHRDDSLWRAGCEGELYCKRVTLLGQLGTQFGDLADDGYGNIGARYYFADENLMVGGDYGHFDERSVWGCEVEYLATESGLSFFGLGGRDGDGLHYILGGVRYYFGAPKNLMRRHREDDPPSILMPGLNRF